jgi:hypothetical protein
MATKTKRPTALQLYKQLQKVRQLQDKVRQEQRKMREMAAQARDLWLNPEKVIIDGAIYEVKTVGGNYQWNWDNRIEVREIGTVEEFAGLIK